MKKQVLSFIALLVCAVVFMTQLPAASAAEAEGLVDALRFDNKTKRRFLGFGEAMKMPLPRNRGELLPPVRLLGWEDAALLAALPGRGDFAALLAEAKGEGLPLRVSELALGGTELLADGAKPGPELGEMLEALLAAVWEGRADNAASSLRPLAEKLLRRHIDSCGAVAFRETENGTEPCSSFTGRAGASPRAISAPARRRRPARRGKCWKKPAFPSAPTPASAGKPFRSGRGTSGR